MGVSIITVNGFVKKHIEYFEVLVQDQKSI